MARIGGYLTLEEHLAFKRYAVSLQLRDSALAGLLIVRELRAKRLRQLRVRFRAGAPVDVRERVTASALNADRQKEFGEHVENVGLTPDQAASILFRAELAERWLENALTYPLLESN